MAFSSRACGRIGLILLVAAGCLPATSTEDDDETGEESETDETSGEEPAPPGFFDGVPLNIAHRGGVLEVPEHTLMAYGHALEVGAHVLELDLHLSADDQMVVIHDETVERTTQGTGAVASMELEALQALDAGYRFTEDGETFPYRGQGLFVPTVEEVFDAYPDSLFAVEIKVDRPEIAELFAEAVVGRGMQAQVYVWSGEPEVTDALRAAPGELMVGLSYAEQIALAVLDPSEEESYLAPGPFAQVPLNLQGLEILDLPLVERAGRHQILVHAWTVNDATEMETLLDWGVAGIITDRPSLLAATLAAREP